MQNETLEIPRKPARGRLTTDPIRTVTSSTFSHLVLEGTGPIVVEFMSYGCAHCRALEPVLQKVAEMVKSTEKVFRLNVAVGQELSDQYQIQGTPTLIMFQEGREVGRVEGPHPTIASVQAAVTQPFES